MEGNMGVAHDLREGELILKVPKSALMTSESLSLKDDKLYVALNAHQALSSTQVWSVGSERLLRNIVFPTIIDEIALGPGENVFFAGGRDGKMYVAALYAGSPLNSKYGFHIIDCFSNHRSSE